MLCCSAELEGRRHLQVSEREPRVCTCANPTCAGLCHCDLGMFKEMVSLVARMEPMTGEVEGTLSLSRSVGYKCQTTTTTKIIIVPMVGVKGMHLGWGHSLTAHLAFLYVMRTGLLCLGVLCTKMQFVGTVSTCRWI